MKHSEARSVHIWLGPDVDLRWPGQDGVRLRIADDGIGLPAGWRDRRADGHLGLQMLVDRLADIGGELVVAPGPSGGTVAEARVPARPDGSGPDNPPVRGGRRSPINV